MDEHAALQAAIHEPIVLLPYDPRWPGAFDDERARFMARWPGTFIDVQHIGSTAVPGLAAKPIIDILAGVASMEVAGGLVEPMAPFGYTTSRAFNATLFDRLWFMRAAAGRRTHHLHVVVHGSPTWHAHLAFRDALRGEPALAARYAALKVELAGRFRDDRDAYTDAKNHFVREVLASVRSG
jgi:GrpB-like predicted nucleotidyltransferase (UPF0157 family)